MYIVNQLPDVRPALRYGSILCILGLVGLANSGFFSSNMPHTFVNGILLGISVVIITFGASMTLTAIARLIREKH